MGELAVQFPIVTEAGPAEDEGMGCPVEAIMGPEAVDVGGEAFGFGFHRFFEKGCEIGSRVDMVEVTSEGRHFLPAFPFLPRELAVEEIGIRALTPKEEGLPGEIRMIAQKPEGKGAMSQEGRHQSRSPIASRPFGVSTLWILTFLTNRKMAIEMAIMTVA